MDEVKKREIEEYEIAKSKTKKGNKKYTIEERLEWVEDAILQLRSYIDDLYEEIDEADERILDLEKNAWKHTW